MKKTILSFLIAQLLFATTILAQVITFQNPSFEGTPQPHVTPPGWDVCMPGVTPDTQPGSWGISLSPSNGNSYIGLVYAPSINWQEGVGQTLSSPLVAGIQYTFFIDLATPASADPLTGIVLPPWCANIQLWGGMNSINSGCDQSQLLWTSPTITNTTWQTYPVTFTPSSNWNHLLFVIYTPPPACTDGQYILMDNIVNAAPQILNDSCLSICSNPATITANGGYSGYAWSTGDSTQSIAITSSGMYYVTATYNSNDYIDSIFVTLTMPFMSLDLGNDTPICTSGSIVLNAGSGYTTYQWNNGSSNSSITVQQTGIYSVYTQDTANCSYYDTIHIVINPAQSLDLGWDTAFCGTGPFLLDASIAFDTYQWSTGDTTQTIDVSVTGTYFVTATNVQCSATVSDSITVVFNPIPIADAGPGDTVCIGQATTLSASGGNSYLWNPTTGLGCPTCATTVAAPNQTTTYTVTVSDNNGCSAMDTVTVNVFNGTVSHIDAHCGFNNGSATVNLNGGVGPYSFTWSTLPVQTTQTAINLSQGTYTVTVTDAGLNCSITKTVVIQNIPGPSLNVVSVYASNCGESNGGISMGIAGGTPPYTYQWNSTPMQQTLALYNVPSGSYCLTVTDGLNCTVTHCDSVTIHPFTPPEICLVTVDTASNHNVIVWEKPFVAGIEEYHLFRESNISGIYSQIGVQNYNNLSAYVDLGSNSEQQPYRYTLSIHDTCGFDSPQSNFHQTVHLMISAGMSGAWNLSWNDYLGFSFSTYNLYRGNSPGTMTLLASLSSNVNSYSDLAPPSGTVYYMIEVVKPIPCNPSYQAKSVYSSISNVANTASIGIEQTDNPGLIIYPNPVDEILSIEYRALTANDPLDIEVYTIQGQLVMQMALIQPRISIDLSSVSQGVYVLKLVGANINLVRRLVKK